MPRRNAPRRANGSGRGGAAPSGGGSIGERVEYWHGVEYRVRAVAGSSASGPYRCPGCDQLLTATGHVVAWPADDVHADDRRHWHSACWQAREQRRPDVQRSRNAPRYG